MASTYSELQTEIIDYMERSDLASKIPGFITQAEQIIKREIRTMAVEKRATASTVAGQQSLALPSDFNGMRHVYRQGSPGDSLEQVAPEKFRSSWMGHYNSTPLTFVVADDHILLGPTPDSAYTIEMDYYAFSALSDSNTTNKVLTNYPDIYLQLSMVEGWRYVFDEEREAKMMTMAMKTLEDIKQNDKKIRYGFSPLKAVVNKTQIV